MFSDLILFFRIILVHTTNFSYCYCFSINERCYQVKSFQVVKKFNWKKDFEGGEKFNGNEIYFRIN